MPELQRLVVPCEWKAVDGETNTLIGYASTFGNVDLGGDVVQKGAFTKTIRAAKANGGKWPFLADHMAATTSVLGSIVDASEDQKGLKIKVQFSSAPSAQDTRIKMLEGHIDRMSIGYEPKAWDFSTDDQGESIRVLKEIKLWEVSAVVFPMNPEAVVETVKSFALDLASKAAHAGVPAAEIKTAFSRESDQLAGWITELNEDIPAAKASVPADRPIPDELKTIIGSLEAAQERVEDAVEDTYPGSWTRVRGVLPDVVIFDVYDYDDGDLQSWRQTYTDDGSVATLTGEPERVDVMEVVIPDADAARDEAEDAGLKTAEPLSVRLARIDALLDGKDPEKNADEVLVTRIESRLELLEAWSSKQAQIGDLQDQLAALRD